MSLEPNESPSEKNRADLSADDSIKELDTLHPAVKIRVKFHRNAIEVKRKVQLKLSPGTHFISFDGVDQEADPSSFRALTLEGAAAVVSANFRFDLAPSTRAVEPTVAELMAPGHESRLENESTVTEHLNSLGHGQGQIQSAASQVEEVQRSINKATRGVEQANRLLREWISQAYEEPALRVAEWREGLDLLEHTLQERVEYLASLQSTHTRLKERLEDESRFNHATKSVILELHVDREELFQIELSYRLTAARWLPIYQARIDEELFNQCGSKPRVDARVHLEMSARYLQATGEDWSRCRAEFSLYPPTVERFPILNYPANEALSLQSTRGLSRSIDCLDLDLHSPLASLCPLFSDQASLSLTLELDLTTPHPQVSVIGAGKLDTLLPLGGGLMHRFVGDEWIGSNSFDPLRLGEELSLDFGLYAPLETNVNFKSMTYEELRPLKTSSVIDAENADNDLSKDDNVQQVNLESATTHEKDQETNQETNLETNLETNQESVTDVGPLKDALGDRIVDLDLITVTIKNVDQNVRTILITHPLKSGNLISLDPQRPKGSAPVGWVLSADRSRLMRWLSIAPNRTEQLTLYRESSL